jgi:hypothetical protein
VCGCDHQTSFDGCGLVCGCPQLDNYRQSKVMKVTLGHESAPRAFWIPFQSQHINHRRNFFL